jgi:hypothetical protein
LNAAQAHQHDPKLTELNAKIESDERKQQRAAGQTEAGEHAREVNAVHRIEGKCHDPAPRMLRRRFERCGLPVRTRLWGVAATDVAQIACHGKQRPLRGSIARRRGETPGRSSG